MAKYNAYTIASWFIQRNAQAVKNEDADNLTLMKLLKLLYYAEGCFLALMGSSLFDEDIIAWEHGPVVVEVYSKYCRDPYNLPLSDQDRNDADKIDQKDEELLEQVFQVFGQYSASGLRNKTHAETPWIEATNNGKVLKRKIDREVMKEYFLNNYVEVN